MNKEPSLDIFELASDDFPQSNDSNIKGGTHRINSKYEKLNLPRAASDRNLIATRESPKQILRSVLSKNVKSSGTINPYSSRSIAKQIELQAMLSTYEMLYPFDSRVNNLIFICFRKLQYVLETIEKQKIEVSFSLDEVIEQTVELTMIEDEKENHQKVQINRPQSQTQHYIGDKPKVNFMAKHQQHVEKNMSKTKEFIPSKLSNHTVQEPVIKLEKPIPLRIKKPPLQDPKPEPAPTSKKADDFKLLMKCVKIWKKYTRANIASKNQKKADMAKLIQAIDFHERRLAIKSFASHRAWLKKARLLSKQSIHLQNLVCRNIRFFYFNTMKKKYIREQRRRYLKKVAKSYFFEQRKFKTFISWQKITKKLKKETDEIYAKINNKYASEILLEQICFPQFLKPKNDGIQEVVKFHFFAVNNLLVINHEKFTKTVEQILQMKQLRVINCLKSNMKTIRNFRNKFSLARKVFRLLKQQIKMQIKIKDLQCKVLYNCMRKSFTSWNFYIVNRGQNEAKKQLLKEKTIKKVQKKYFQEWEKLYSYYSRFTKSNYCYTQKKLSDLHFEKKWFDILKAYYLMRQKHNRNITIADQKFFNRHIRFCFQNWAFFSNQNRNLRFAKNHLQKKYQKSEKTRYFTGLKRAFKNSILLKQFYRKNLAIKTFRSFQRMRQYLELRDNMILICLQQYQSKLLKKSYHVILNNAQENVRLSSLKKVYIAQQKVVKKRQIWGFLIRNVQIKAQKQENMEIMGKISEVTMMRKVLYSMFKYAKGKQDLQLKYRVLKNAQEENLRNRCLEMMVKRFKKRVQDKRLGKVLKDKIEEKVVRENFEIWVRKYKHLKLCDEILSKRIQKGIYSDIFKLWRIKYLIKKDFNHKTHYFNEKVRIRSLKLFFEAFHCRILQKSKNRQNKRVSDYLFLKNKVQKCLQILGYHSYYSRVKRDSLVRYRIGLKFQVFKAIQYKWLVKSKVKKNLQKAKEKGIKEIFEVVKVYAKKKIINREKVRSFMEQKALKTLTLAFKILVCPEFYESREPRKLELHEINQMKNVFNNWFGYTEYRKSTAEKFHLLKAKHESLQTELFIKLWRTEFYLADQERHIAIPHFTNVIQKSTILSVFNILSSRVQESHKKVNCDLYYKESIITKSLESLKWYADTQIQRKRIIQYMAIQRNKEIIVKCFQGIKTQTERQKNIKQKLQIIQSRNLVNLQQLGNLKIFSENNSKSSNKYVKYYFKLWQKQTEIEKLLQPTNQYITSEYNLKLLSQVFKSLYKNRTFRIIKSSMKQQADTYFKSSTMRKSFESLLWYSIHRNKKYAMNEAAEIQFKRSMIKRWVEVLNRVQVVKEEIKKIHYIGEYQSENKRMINSISGISNYRSSTESLLPPRARPPTSQNTNLNINELKTSEELKNAHDIMSQHLQSLLSRNSESKEIDTLRQLISDIKHKYQLSRMQIPTETIHIEVNPTSIESERCDIYDKKLMRKAFKGIREIGLIEEQAKQFSRLQLKLKVIRSIKRNREWIEKNEEMISKKHQMVLKHRSIKTLMEYKESSSLKSYQFTMSLSHYIQRQYRLGIYAFKKNHLMLVMQRSILSQIQTRFKHRLFNQWRDMLQQEKQSNSSSDLEPNARMSNELLQDFQFDNGFNNTAGTKFSELDFGVNDNPQPFVGFNEEEKHFVEQDSLEDLFKGDQKIKKANFAEKSVIESESDF